MTMCVFGRKSLAAKKAKEERFDRFLEAFGIDKHAETGAAESYRGDILGEREILAKFFQLGLIANSFLGRLMGKAYILWRKFKDPACYYSTYEFELVDVDQWRLRWFDRVGF